MPGNRVLLRGPTTPWLAACWLAVLKAGAVAVTVLAQHRPQELATVCALPGARPVARRVYGWIARNRMRLSCER